MAAAAFLAVMINMLLTAGAMAVMTGRGIERTIGTMLAFVPTQLTLALVGYLIAQALAINALALPLFIVPLVVARQLYMRYAGLKAAYVDTVRSLVGALEAKDPYTRGHSERVSMYAESLGAVMNISPRELSDLSMPHCFTISASSPCQLGADQAGQLEPEEMAGIREHPARGAGMIRRIPPLRDLADAVEQHHEWFDGTGYPGQRQGTELSIAARILSVADCYDAMTTTRSYRRALSREEAIAELLDGADTQFDKDIVRVFVEHRLGQDSDALEIVDDTVAGRVAPIASAQGAPR